MFGKAVAAFQRFIALDGESSDVCFQMGLALSSLDRLEDAERYLAKAALASPANPRIHYQLGIVRDRLGRSLEAKDSYRRADELHAKR
jgi:Flp pilus assembly protein TadD